MTDMDKEFDSRAHLRLLDAVNSLGKTQSIRKPIRHEKAHEFGLIKKKSLKKPADQGFATGAQAVKVNDIVKVLKDSNKHQQTGKLLTNVRKTKKVLERTLPKPQAERIKRAIGYEHVKKKLTRWNAIVAENRSSTTQVFPLPASETIYVNTSAYAKPLERNNKTDLQNELLDTDAKLNRLIRERSEKGNIVNDEGQLKREEDLSERKLTRDALIARRRELRYIKIRKSQLQVKARMQNKVKSKRYHKLLKQQKMKEQMKEFELLQKTNPEAAFEKLNVMERNRIQERASLKHKNTGTWAKNLQMRAKYDKTVRENLAEQLQISRELTQKQQAEETDDDDNDDEEEEVNFNAEEETQIMQNAQEAAFNPWTKLSTANKSVNNANNIQENSTNWRKYWLEMNINKSKLQQLREENHEVGKKQAVKRTYENGWLVEDLVEDKKKTSVQNIESIFDEQEAKVESRLKNKMQKLTKEFKKDLKATKTKKLKKNTKKQKVSINKSLEQLENLTFKNTGNKVVPKLDEELTATPIKENIDVILPENLQEKIVKSTTLADKDKKNKNVTSLRLQKHQQELELNNDDDDYDDGDEEGTEQQITINEAFEDDDIVADFANQKSADSKIKDDEIQLHMAGWGSWAGAGISPEVQAKRKARAQSRLMLKLAEKEKQTAADAKKPNVYINETATKELRSHLVKDLPFPFNRVKDFEASVRAPVGRNFLPETAFRKLILPTVRVRKGQLIEPMDESVLVKPATKR